MNFEELHNYIPYAKGGKEKVLTMEPYPGVTLAMPGRHAKDTVPIGGDFVVMIDTPTMQKHQFKHDDIFLDVGLRRSKDDYEDVIFHFMEDYRKIVTGGDPRESVAWPTPAGCIDTLTFMNAVQCLAVAEHRRYAKFESKVGGRYLPFRFAAGIAAGNWTSAEAIALQKSGRPGVEMLEKQYGLPQLTVGLFKCLQVSHA